MGRGLHSRPISPLPVSLDPSIGVSTPVAGSPSAVGANPASVAVDPLGKYLYVGNNSLGSNSQIFAFPINQTSGALAPIAGSPYASSETPYFVTIDPSGDLVYVANLQSDSITVYSLDKATGLGVQGPAIEWPSSNA